MGILLMQIVVLRAGHCISINSSCWRYPEHSIDVEAPTGLANILIKMKEGEHDNSRMMVVRLTRSVFLAGCSSLELISLTACAYATAKLMLSCPSLL